MKNLAKKLEEEWLPQYAKPPDGVAMLSKALVVIGGTQCGKSVWCGHHFGFDRRFVTDCKGRREFPMSGFSRKKYRCLQLDEAGPEMFQKCNILRQGSIWPTFRISGLKHFQEVLFYFQPIYLGLLCALS